MARTLVQDNSASGHQRPHAVSSHLRSPDRSSPRRSGSSTRAATATPTHCAPAALSAQQHPSAVAPVVSTSSTSRILRPAIRPGLRTRRRREIRGRVPRGEGRRASACCRCGRAPRQPPGSPSRRPASRARSAAWLNPCRQAASGAAGRGRAGRRRRAATRSTRAASRCASRRPAAKSARYLNRCTSSFAVPAYGAANTTASSAWRPRQPGQNGAPSATAAIPQPGTERLPRHRQIAAAGRAQRRPARASRPAAAAGTVRREEQVAGVGGEPRDARRDAPHQPCSGSPDHGLDVRGRARAPLGLRRPVAAAVGMMIVKTVPAPTALATSMRPLCSRTMLREM